MANKVKVSEFSESLVKYLRECLPSGPGLDREKMWSKFHIFRTSKDHFILWNAFLKNSIKKGGPIFLQHITNYIFKQLVKKRVPVATLTTSQQTTYSTQSLTYDEKNALQYAAGYIPRNLKQKIKRSSYSNKKALQMCLQDVIEEDGMGDDDSQDWVKLVDRGGLMLVTSSMFQFVSAMELVVKGFLEKKEKPINVKNEMLKLIEGNTHVDINRIPCQYNYCNKV